MSPGPAVDELVGALGALASRLGEVVPAVERSVAGVAGSWSDAAGAAWTDRADHAVRALLRELDAVTELREAVDRAVAEQRAGAEGWPGWAVSPVRLGSTAGRRATDEHGMHVARLGEDADDGFGPDLPG